MVKRVQGKFFLIAMGAMGFCVVALIAVINILHGVQVDRQLDQALTEMVETMEALRADRQAAAETEPEWRVESFVEEETVTPEPTETPEESEDPEVSEDPEASLLWPPEDGERPFGKGKKKQPWWLQPEEWEREPEETPEATETPPPPQEETVVNHYYYYYPTSEEGDLDLRQSAMNQYSGRLCVVYFPDGDAPQAAMSDSSALTETEAVALAEQMRTSAAGDLDDYRYQVRSGDGGDWVYFLDCATEHRARRSLLLASCLAGLGGLLVMGIFVFFMSRKAIEPLKESMERQKRFITDAGHELKTPLAVIGTNMDILELDLGKNEWVDGTKKQLSRLRKLVANLISLSKLEEMREADELQPFSLSDMAQECTDAFLGPAELAGKALLPDLTSDLTVLGDPMTAGQLLTILLDNAVKYSEGDVQVRLYASGRRVCFETENPWDRSVPASDLPKLFDRFYRGDASRSGQGGRAGYGLGLSIAMAIAEKNRAQLTVAETETGTLLFRAAFRKSP